MAHDSFIGEMVDYF
jgi:hypothetical protein